MSLIRFHVLPHIFDNKCLSFHDRCLADPKLWEHVRISFGSPSITCCLVGLFSSRISSNPNFSSTHACKAIDGNGTIRQITVHANMKINVCGQEIAYVLLYVFSSSATHKCFGFIFHWFCYSNGLDLNKILFSKITV